MGTAVELRQRASLRGVEELVAQGCLVGGISVTEFYGRGRTAHVCRARAVVWIALRRRGWSYPEIGWLSGRVHSTVMYAIAPFFSEPFPTCTGVSEGNCHATAGDAR